MTGFGHLEGNSILKLFARSLCLSEMATAAGRTVCGEDPVHAVVGFRQEFFPHPNHHSERHNEKQAVLHSLPAIKASLSGMDSVPSRSV